MLSTTSQTEENLGSSSKTSRDIQKTGYQTGLQGGDAAEKHAW